MPPLIPLIIAGIEAALQAAPQIADVVDKAKALISSLFTAGVITAEQQNTLHAHIDQHAADLAAGNVPTPWTVEPDPTDTAYAPQAGSPLATPPPTGWPTPAVPPPPQSPS